MVFLAGFLVGWPLLTALGAVVLASTVPENGQNWEWLGALCLIPAFLTTTLALSVRRRWRRLRQRAWIPWAILVALSWLSLLPLARQVPPSRMVISCGAPVGPRPLDREFVQAAKMGKSGELIRLSWNDPGLVARHLELLHQTADPETREFLWNAAARDPDCLVRATLGHPELVRALLQKGADPNARNSLGISPLRWANPECARLLRQAGARQPNPLCEAAQVGDPARLVRLLNAGWDPNRLDEDGDSPLWLAVKARNETAVRTLLEHGARANLRCQALARTLGERTIAMLLEKRS